MREMRPKAYAIIDAWFSADDRSLEFLRNHYGVSHFVIDKARRADRSLLYFEPFNQYILTKRADSEGKRRWIDAPPRQSVLFENEGYIITDLRRLASTDH
jgi:cytolysin (calcineurin-like family phosphatase)